MQLPHALPRITSHSVIRRFARHLCLVGPPSLPPCWIWTGSRDHKGYGYFRYAGRVHRAHRISYAIYNGPIPDNQTVHHTFIPPGYSAPIPWDVNPAHLTLLPLSANVAEANARGPHRGIVRLRANIPACPLCEAPMHYRAPLSSYQCTSPGCQHTSPPPPYDHTPCHSPA